jgi:hypothetical protein
MKNPFMSELEVIDTAKDFLAMFGCASTKFVFSCCRYCDEEYEHSHLRSKWIVFFDIADDQVLASSSGAKVYVRDTTGTASFNPRENDFDS